ncbi:MAG TPA: flagellar basal body P-ring protein FlgI [Syntrophobacteraceae bacterium]|nr:flagellar basal body P-ring protein FlgI [Syntrophobacteraceae bacterium]
MGRTGTRTLPAALLLTVLFLASVGHSARIKDLAYFRGTTSNPLIGYGLVVGLNGTGDKDKTMFTVNTLANLLDNVGIRVDPTQIKVKNVAAVMVTAKLPPFARVGTRIDIQVSSIGDAKSLEGGTLLLTPLQGPDAKTYALAQGPISVGGFSVSGQSGSTVQKNHPTVGFVSGGATVEQEVQVHFTNVQQLDLILKKPDFTTATRAMSLVNSLVPGANAQAVDAATIKLTVPASFQGRVPEMITQVENLEIQQEITAKIVVNERTGTIVMGESVKIHPVAVAHGSLTVQITEQQAVSQPLPFSRGETTVTPQTRIEVQEGKGALSMVGGVTIGQVVKGLNAIGASPRDLINILQTIKAAGALQAELEII